MSQICMFGVSGSGKTCYLYAMSQVLLDGARNGNFRLLIRENDLIRQNNLNAGYLQLIDGRWPQNSVDTTEYDFNVKVQVDNALVELIPSLVMEDYRGGIWNDNNNAAINGLLNSFKNATSIVFMIDGSTLLSAMDISDLHPMHRNSFSIRQRLVSLQQITFAEAMFHQYKQMNNNNVPAVIVAITKSDKFIDRDEIENGRRLIIDSLPSLFAKGCGVDAAIVNMSLGDNLGTNNQGQLVGNLDISTGHNIHQPMVFSLYSYLDRKYVGFSPNEKILADKVMRNLQDMMEGHVKIFVNGWEAYRI